MVRISVLTATLILVAGPVLGGAVGVSDGLQFSQFDLTFDGASQANSAFGLAAVDFDKLTTNTSITTGYLNIATSAGWVVQNMLVDSNSGYPGSSTMFNLGSTAGVDVSTLGVTADFSSSPTTSFSLGTTTAFSVGDLSYNAQGRGAMRSTAPTSSTTPTIAWTAEGLTEWVQQAFRESVEQDKNQCGPGALANSLQFLEDEYGIVVPHAHTPGIDGKDGDGKEDESLVGEIDQLMGRGPQKTVSDAAFMAGKLNYIAANGLGDKLILKHWGGTFVSGDQTSTDGTVTSEDQTAGISLIDWIIQEIKNGEDVELALAAPAGSTVGHWVNVTDAGRTKGVTWVSWTHDANQGNDGGTSWHDGGVGWSPVVDGKLVYFLEGMKLDFAVSESVPLPGALPMGLALLGGFLAIRYVRRRRTGCERLK